MRKLMVMAGALALMFVGVSLNADAATIDNLSGQSCGEFTGNWHFVNNQTGGAAPGILTATWSSGDSCSVSASAVNKKTQHFNCVASGELESASTNLPGRLVLSDFSCDEPEKPCEGKDCPPAPK